MKLVLRKDIDRLGLCGDVVEVSAGYARNYLLPHHLALEPTKGNLKRIEEDKKAAAAVRARRRVELEGTLKRLTGVEVTISAASTPEGHLYGSVGPREISRALLDEGHSVHPDQLKMSENIKEIGTLEVPIILADDLSASVKVWVVRERSADEVDEEPGETDVTDSNTPDGSDGSGAEASDG
ncbi:MAG: 50S ribosomal protein L9 [Phycisphaerae bacterium]